MKSFIVCILIIVAIQLYILITIFDDIRRDVVRIKHESIKIEYLLNLQHSRLEIKEIK